MLSLLLIGMAVLTVLAIVAVVVFWKLKSVFIAPARIHVTPSISAKWKDKQSAEEKRRALMSLGFKEMSTYTIKEMSGLILNNFVLPEKRIMAVLYEFPLAGQWIDFVAEYSDGSTLTASNATTGHELEHRPQHDKLYIPNGDTAALYEKFTERLGNKKLAPLPATPPEFIAKFEKAYADEMDWRNARGGPTEEEILRVAQNANIKVNDAMLEDSTPAFEKQAYEGLRVALKEKLREKRALGDNEWSNIQDRLVFIHNNMSKQFVTQLLDCPEMFEDASVDRAYANMTPRETFRRLNDKLNKFQKFDELKDPVEADVYYSAK